MNNKHMATPWVAWIDGDLETFIGRETGDPIASGLSEQDAAFIVQACNAHDDLVAALKLAVQAHELVGAAQASMSDKLYGPNGLARAALAKAGAA